MRKNYKRKYQIWLKLQRKIKSVNIRIETATSENESRHLLKKLNMLVKRLFNLNKKWRMGIATATLFLWLGNYNINAQQVLDYTNLNGVNGFKIVDSNQNGKLGWDISSAGDFNGDGLQDMIISSCDQGTPNNAGGAYVIFGTTNTFSPVLDVSTLDGTNGFSISDSMNNNNTGVSVSSAGDFNGDGFDDLLIGESQNNYNSGSIYVLFGNNQNLSEVNLNTLNGTNGFQVNADSTSMYLGLSLKYFGQSLSGIGDINNDGYDDVAFSWAPQLEYNYVDILYGSNASYNPINHIDSLVNLNRISVFSYPYAPTSYYMGGNEDDDAISHGDINGDGFEDIAIGFGGAIGDNGGAFVLFGSNQQLADSIQLDTLDGQIGFQFAGYEYYGYMGSSLDVADINGDGFDDIITGHYAGYYYDNAKTTVLFGKGTAFTPVVQASTLNGTDGFEITGLNPDPVYSTVTVGVIDDVNSDGIDDILIGVDKIAINSVNNSGQIHVVFGNNGTWPANYDINTLNNTSGFKINGASAGEKIGTKVAGIGDLNGDGNGDFAFAGTAGQEAYVVFGSGCGIELLGSNENASVCSGEDYTYPDGTIASNLIADTFHESTLISQVNGCDSTVTTNITVNSVNVLVTANGSMLTANDTTATSYQWVDCDNGNSIIIGETAGVFTATQTGNYAVEVNANGCVDTSSCNVVSFAGIEDKENIVQSIYPNPTTGLVNINLNEQIGLVELSVVDISGRTILKKEIENNGKIISIDLPGESGVYFIQVKSNFKTATYKIIKK